RGRRDPHLYQDHRRPPAGRGAGAGEAAPIRGSRDHRRAGHRRQRPVPGLGAGAGRRRRLIGSTCRPRTAGGNHENSMFQLMVRTRPAWRVLMGCLALVAAWAVLAWRPAAALGEEDFLPPEQAFVFSAAMAGPDTVELRYRIAPGYYMYRERFGLAISPQGATTLGQATYPQGEVKYDPTFEKDMEVYHDQVAIRVPLAEGQPFTLTVTSQGCADAGLCYPPMDHAVRLVPATGGYAVDGVAAPADTAGAAGTGASASSGGLGALLSAGDLGLADAIGGLGWLKTAGVFWLLGLLLAFTPCVL